VWGRDCAEKDVSWEIIITVKVRFYQEVRNESEFKRMAGYQVSKVLQLPMPCKH
jgi:hypothetical protein